jgi:uncharacterized UPF0160 family protein
VQSIDAADNHVMVCHPGTADISAFEFFDVIDTLKPIWGSEETYDSQFVLAVDFARSLLCRLIRHAKVQSDMHAEIKRQYESEKEKYVLEFDRPVPRHALVKYEEVQVVVSPVPAEDVDHWMAAVVPVHPRSFQNRAVFPETWAGLADEALAEISHIKDAIFCHKERYIFVAESKEGAMKAAHRAKM